MKLSVLGCSGGIGGKLRTTSLLLDDDVLIDAGTGVADLDLDALRKIDHVFLTHSHLDHVVSIPFMLDSVAADRERPLRVYALRETIQALQLHIFNWNIWPDFTRIPDVEKPSLQYHELLAGDIVELGGRRITVLPAHHVVPAVGYAVSSTVATLAYSGDTALFDEFWDCLNTFKNLKYLVVETAFSNSEMNLAKVSKHLCPSMLAAGLSRLKSAPEIYITHLKPGADELIMREVSECLHGLNPNMLKKNHVFEL